MSRDRHTIRSTYDNRPASVPLFGVSTLAAALSALAVVVFIGGLSIWWFYVRTNVTAEIRQDGFNFQQGQVDRVLALSAELADIDVTLADPETTDAQTGALNASREQIRRSLCAAYVRINNPQPTIRTIAIEENC